MKDSLKTLYDNLKYMIRQIWIYDCFVFLFFVLCCFIEPALNCLEIYVPKLLLGILLQNVESDLLVLRILWLGSAILLLTLLQSWATNVFQRKCGLIRTDLFLSLLVLKRLKLRYECLEDPATEDLMQRAKYVSWSNNVGVEATLNNLKLFVSGFIV